MCVCVCVCVVKQCNTESIFYCEPAFISLHDSVVIHSTSGSDIHDGHAEVVFFYSVYRFFSGDWSHNTSEYS